MLNYHIKKYLTFCVTQKCLDTKTIKAYRIDLNQFSKELNTSRISDISLDMLESYIAHLHVKFKPKTAKRKIAAVKAFFNYLEYKDLIMFNPFNKMRIKFREPITLPKTIPINTLENLLRYIYNYHRNAKTIYQRQKSLQDIMIVEILFSTGIRISELCSIKASDINSSDNTLIITGKGNKERRLQLCNENVLTLLSEYKQEFQTYINKCGYLFANHSGKAISEQSVRRMINKYVSLCGIDMHITPHMFRHTFATSLLESDVDIRYIQEMLGHSSITITEIYTHVTTAKQKDILKNKHPRRYFNL